MATDINGREVVRGDWVKIPDVTHPFNNGPNRYKVRCRHHQVSAAYSDAVLTVRLTQVFDWNNMDAPTFEMGVDLYAADCTLVKNADGFIEEGGTSEAPAPYVMGEQPRDAQGRFTSITTTVRPVVFDNEGNYNPT